MTSVGSSAGDFLDFADDKLAAGLVNHEVRVIEREERKLAGYVQAMFRPCNQPALGKLLDGRKMTDDELRSFVVHLKKIPEQVPNAIYVDVKVDLSHPLKQKRYCEAKVLYVACGRDTPGYWPICSMRVTATRDQVHFVHHYLPLSLTRHVVERFLVRGLAARRGIRHIASHVVSMSGFVAAFARALTPCRAAGSRFRSRMGYFVACWASILIFMLALAFPSSRVQIVFPELDLAASTCARLPARGGSWPTPR